MKTSGEDIETFASEVLDTIEKQALLGSLVSAQLKNTKMFVSDPIGATMTALPVVSGRQSLLSAVTDAVVPLKSQVKSFVQDVKQTKLNNRLPAQSMQGPLQVNAFADTTALMKIAAIGQSGDNIKDTISNIGVSVGAGAAGYATVAGINKLIDNKPGFANGVSFGIDNAVSTVGKQTAKTLSKDKPLTDSVAKVMKYTGKYVDSFGPQQGKFRLDYTTLDGKPPRAKSFRNLGLYLALLAGANLGEELLTDKFKEKWDSWNPFHKDKTSIDSHFSQDATQNRNRSYSGGNTRGRNNNYGHNRYNNYNKYNDNRPRTPYIPDSQPLMTDQVLASDSDMDVLFKEAMDRDMKYILADRVMRPALITGTFLASLGGLSRLVGRNLYGGFEKVKTDEEANNTSKVMIDIPKSELESDDHKSKLIKSKVSLASAFDPLFLEKEASPVVPISMVDDLAHVSGEAGKSIAKAVEEIPEKTKLDKVKDALDSKIQKGPKAIRKIDNILAEGDANKYPGKRGLANLMLEEIPFKVIEGLAYATPMAAVALSTNRNLKRAFEPIKTDPNISAPPGYARITIEESKEDMPAEKKALDEALELVKIDSEIQDYNKNKKPKPVDTTITNNKNKEDQKLK